MKLFSLLLLAAGWFLVAMAIALLKLVYIPVFVIAGVLVEGLGLVLLARQHAVETAKLSRSQEPRY